MVLQLLSPRTLLPLLELTFASLVGTFDHGVFKFPTYLFVYRVTMLTFFACGYLSSPRTFTEAQESGI